MNVGQAVIKLLLHYLPYEILVHIANELDQRANHLHVVGALRGEAYTRAQADGLRKAAKTLQAIPY